MITLPDTCHWRTRLQIAQGLFRYQDAGILDRGHLRFFTYWTAVEPVTHCNGLTLLRHWPVGGFILGPLRAWMPRPASHWLDRQATQRWSNQFGFETHLLAERSK